MSFEEEFPSLKCPFDACNDEEHFKEKGGHMVFCPDGDFFHKKDIQKHCLDKQRVKEAIIKIKQWEHHDLSKDWDIELLKELKLEDEK